jgi:hypothetical protein
MRRTVRSAARERDWAMVAESYAMQPSSSYRLRYSDRQTDRIGRGAIDSRELSRLEFLRSTGYVTIHVTHQNARSQGSCVA